MTTFGWDMSHYDAPSIGNALAEGISFLTHKAGGDASDPEIAQWWNNVKGLNPDKVMLGAYWVQYPGNPIGKADAFLARLDATCPGWRNRPFILQVDCERWNNDPGTVPSISDVNAFCDRLVAKMPKLRPIGYLPDWVYGDISKFKYTVWSSKYAGGSGPFKSLYPGDNSSLWAGYGGKSVTILQYSSKATIGGQTTSDANAFRGTLAQLQAILAPGWKKEVVAAMDWDDKIQQGTTSDTGLDGRTFRMEAGDAENLRNWQYAPENGATVNPPPTNSRAALLHLRVKDVSNRLSVVDSQTKSNGGGISELKTRITALEGKVDQIIALLQAPPV